MEPYEYFLFALMGLYFITTIGYGLYYLFKGGKNEK